MDFKKPKTRSNLRVSTLKFDSYPSTKVSSEDMESTRDKMTPLTSPFLEIKDYSIVNMVIGNSPVDHPFRTVSVSKLLQSRTRFEEQFKSTAFIDQPDRSASISQKPSIEMWDSNLNAKNWGLPKKLANIYEIISEIGRGRQGTIMKLKEKATGLIVAAKVLFCSDEEIRTSIVSEIETLQRLSHSNIIKYQDSHYDQESSTFWLLMEYFPSVTLLQFLKDLKEATLSQNKIKTIMRQLLDCLAYLHNLRVCHRDLNLENVLINPNDYNVKIIDFGISKTLQDHSQVMFSPVGNVNSRAPEFFDQQSYSIEYDVWQLGLIFAQIVRKETISTKKARKIIAELKQEEGINEEGRELLGRMLEVNPKTRINCEEAIKNEWFKDINC